MQYRESQMENSTLTTNKETACDDMSLENHNMDLETTKNRLLLFNDTLQKSGPPVQRVVCSRAISPYY